MPAPPTLHTMRVYELLGDGEWHELEGVLRAAAAIVPPGVAKRAMEAAEAAERQRRRTEQRRADRARHDVPSLIRRGQRRIALLAINRNRRIESQVNDDGVREIRLRPKATSAVAET